MLVIYDLRDHEMLLARCDQCHAVFDSDAQECAVCAALSHVNQTAMIARKRREDKRRR